MAPRFAAEITLGEVIGYGLAAAIPLAVWLVHRWRQAHPFSVVFPKVPVGVKALEYDRTDTSKWNAPIGVSIIPIIVRNRYGTNLRWFSPRFGTQSYRPSRRRHALSWDNARPDTIEVIGIRMLPKRGLAHTCLRVRTDDVDVHFDNFAWAANEPLEFQLLVDAKQEWDGRFSFYSRNEQHDERRWGHARVRVTGASDQWDSPPLNRPRVDQLLSDPEWRLDKGIDADA